MVDYEKIHMRTREEVERVLAGDTSGHGIDHVDRVYLTAMHFAGELPDVDRHTVALAALLHDVDDYKLVGKEQAERLTNATAIMDRVGIDQDMQMSVKGIIHNMGYGKALHGVRPASIEGMIVSDADMCDALGAGGMVRCLQYALGDKGSGIIFDPAIWPNVDISHETYTSTTGAQDTDSFVNHHSEKLLKLPSIMMTEPGRREAVARREVMVQFLGAYFKEQNRPEWNTFLEQYLSSL
jgi:uncharacterized protein